MKPSPFASHASLDVFWPKMASPNLLSSETMDALISVVLWNADDPPMEVVVCEMDAEFLTGSFVIMFIVPEWQMIRRGPIHRLS